MAQHGTKAKGGKEWGAAGRKAEGKGLRAADKRLVGKEADAAIASAVRKEEERADTLVRTGKRCSNCRQPQVARKDTPTVGYCERCDAGPVTWDDERERNPAACSECGLDIKHGDQVVDCYVWACDGTLKSIELLHEGCDR